MGHSLSRDSPRVGLRVQTDLVGRCQAEFNDTVGGQAHIEQAKTVDDHIDAHELGQEESMLRLEAEELGFAGHAEEAEGDEGVGGPDQEQDLEEFAQAVRCVLNGQLE